jgi:hypothetical protein
MTASDYLALRPPVPAGFALLLGLSARLVPDPEWSLQLVPVACSVVLIPLIGWLLLRVTGQPALGLLGAAMVVADPRLSTFGVRAKPYASDGLLAIALLLLATWVADRPGTRHKVLLAIASVGAALFSFPALLVGGSVVGAFLLCDLADRAPGRRRGWLVAPLVFLVGSALIYVVLLRGVARPGLVRYWRNRFLPLGGLGEVADFLSTSGLDFLTDPFPRRFGWLALLVPIGLALIFRKRATRWLAVVIVLLGTQLLAASALRRYPVGGGRTDLFAHGILILLACCSLVPLLASRGKAWWRGAAVVAAAGLALVSARPSRYPPRRDADLVRRAHAVLGPEDLLLVHPTAGLAVAYYWPGEVRLVPRRRPCGFTGEVRDHASRTLETSFVRGRLGRLLRGAPARLVYLGANTADWVHRDVVESIGEAGYDVESRDTGPAAALIVFCRRTADPSRHGRAGGSG